MHGNAQRCIKAPLAASVPPPMLLRLTAVLVTLALASSLAALNPPTSLSRCDSAGDLRLACRADAFALENWRLLAARDLRERAREARRQAKASDNATANTRGTIFIVAVMAMTVVCYAVLAAARASGRAEALPPGSPS